MAPVARGVADTFRVLEPVQRGSGGEPRSHRDNSRSDATRESQAQLKYDS